MATLRWHLALLGIAGVALSIASGWTTWDGMANFTHNPILSFLITFGIQSIMLIAAWMIGESFAKHTQATKPEASERGDYQHLSGLVGGNRLHPVHSETRSTLLWIVVFAASMAVLSEPVAGYFDNKILGIGAGFAALIAGVMILRKACHLLGFGSLIEPYERSTAAILKNVPLWLMFLVCMAASVFFSFDSLFDEIYSTKDRESASQSRVQSHVTGLLQELHVMLEDRRSAAVSALPDSHDWASFEDELREIAAAVGSTRTDIAARWEAKARARDIEAGDNIALLSEARSEMDSIDARISREKRDLDRISNDLAKEQSTYERVERELNGQRLKVERKAREATVEASGAGITQIRGKGPRYRDLKAQQADLQIKVDQLVASLGTSDRRLEALAERQTARANQLAQLESQQSEIASRIARAEWQLENSGQTSVKNKHAVENLTAGLAELKAARGSFLNWPDQDTYSALKTKCLDVTDRLHALSGGDSRTYQCDTLAGSDTLTRILETNADLDRFNEKCAETREIAKLSAEDLFQVGQSCIGLSGLATAETTALRSNLRQVILRRDDQAHRFVVTWNAFFDTNPLAFVALFIALSIDGLVFVTGLFGANAEVSMRVLSRKTPPNERSASNTFDDVILDFAMLPDVAENARLLLDNLSPASLDLSNGLPAEINLSDMDPQSAARIRPALNTACAVGLAEKRGDGQLYGVKIELIEHLSSRLGWQRGVTGGTLVESNPEEMLGVALGRERQQIVQSILEYVQPLPPDAPFAYVLDAFDCPEALQSQIVRVLNTAIAAGMVSGDTAFNRRYFLTAAFIAMLTRLSARQADPLPPLETPVERSDPPGDETENVTSNANDQMPDLPNAGSTVVSIVDSGGTRDQAGAPQMSADRTGVERSTGKPPRDESKDSRGIKVASELDRQESGDITNNRAEGSETSSKLITFPIETSFRSQKQTDRGPANMPGYPPDPHISGIEAAVADLIKGTKISRADVFEWMDSDAGRKFDDAWLFVERLRDDGFEFASKLERDEKTASHKFDRFRQALAQQTASSNSDDLASHVYKPYFLSRFVVSKARNWCENTLTEMEASALLETDPAVRDEQVQLISETVTHLSSLDKEHGEEWSDIALRARGIGRHQTNFEEFSDLMP